MTQVTLSKGGTHERDVNIHHLPIPNLWHIAMQFSDQGKEQEAQMILECWHIAHDLKTHIVENREPVF